MRRLRRVVRTLALGGTVRPAAAPPGAFYLALGDSVAYGMQPQKFDAGLPPSGYGTGYVDVFAARLRKLRPGLRVVNYSCPGESTRTFASGGCPWLADATHRLHDSYHGTQLAAALAFLRLHPGRVSPITLHLGGADVQAVYDGCRGELSCIRARSPRATRRFVTRFGSILRRLRGAAPSAEIVVTGLWNNNIDRLPETDPPLRALNRTIAKVTKASKARFADVFPAFNPQSSVARERARICTLTFVCSRGDGHPTDAGYRAIAATVWAASGYAQRS
ncbi:MAG: SGNH/GDSL hydrolase family protein [Gaiellales bacterium]